MMRDVKILALPTPRFEPHGSRYRLVEDYAFAVEVEGCARAYMIPAGYETDGGSVPRIGWRVAGQPFDPRYIAAYLVHDWIYSTHIVERDVADAVLYHAMRREGASWAKARMYYYAVRWFGGGHWTQNKERQEQMKKVTMGMVFAACVAIFSGCQLTHVKTPEWEVSLRSHWFKRDVDKCEVQRNKDGSYSVSLNGYRSDASEQLPAFTKELWYGLGVLGRLAGAAVNPAVAGVPLSDEAAKADDMAKLIREAAAAKAELAKAKAELKSAKAESGDCPDGSCGL